MKYILILLMGFVSLSHAYSYAAAGKEPTIDAKEAIIKAVNADDYAQAMRVFKEHEKNYTYLSKEFIPKLYTSLNLAITNKNKEEVMKALNLSLAAEVQRRIDGGLQNINNYNIAKVMVLKARKFYKLLSISLSKADDAKLKNAIKGAVKAIGNPGIFGVGSEPSNPNAYRNYQKTIIEVVQSL